MFTLPDSVKQGEEVDCGWLVVPENRDILPSRAIRLAVAIFHPVGGARAADPVIYLSGGPGGSAQKAIQYSWDEEFAPLVEMTRRDLIIFDQRGVGVSRPALVCPMVENKSLELMKYDPRTFPQTTSDISEQMLSSFLECRDQLSQTANLGSYHSTFSAADVHDLRNALGYQQVNLWGISYGTRLGLEVMRLYPEGIRSVVLDSVYPPDVDLYA